jgi:hypothetical protein
VDSALDVAVYRIHATHRMLLALTEELPEAQFCWVPGPMAPPIGWHLWHIARWADRVQASFPAASGAPSAQIWEEEELVHRWELDRAMLGPLQVGLGMQPQAANRLVQDVGQARHLDYARRSFGACDAAVARLQPGDFELPRVSVKAFCFGGRWDPMEAPPGETTVASELMFHSHHGGRHLGMIEALLGVQGLDGTASN